MIIFVYYTTVSRRVKSPKENERTKQKDGFCVVLLFVVFDSAESKKEDKDIFYKNKNINVCLCVNATVPLDSLQNFFLLQI